MTTPGEPQAANHNPFALLRRITCQGVGVWEERVPEESGSTSSSAPPARRWVGSATWPGPRRGSAPSRQGKYYLSYSAYRETWRRLYWAFLSCLSPMMPRGSIRIKRFCMFRFYLYSLLMTLHVSRRPEQVHGPTETPLNENALGLVSQAATQRWGAWTQRALRSGSHQGPESRTGTCAALRVVWFCTQTLHCWSETARAPAGRAQRVWAAPTGAATRSRPVGIKTSSQSIWKKNINITDSTRLLKTQYLKTSICSQYNAEQLEQWNIVDWFFFCIRLIKQNYFCIKQLTNIPNIQFSIR